MRFLQDLDQNSALIHSFSNTKNFPRLRFDEASAILRKNGDLIGPRLSRKNEFYLIDYCKSPLFVTNFPAVRAPFYMSRSECGKYVYFAFTYEIKLFFLLLFIDF